MKTDLAQIGGGPCPCHRQTMPIVISNEVEESLIIKTVRRLHCIKPNTSNKILIDYIPHRGQFISHPNLPIFAVLNILNITNAEYI